jgi:hypothetical protein
MAFFLPGDELSGITRLPAARSCNLIISPAQMRLFFASGIILFIRTILHIKRLQKLWGITWCKRAKMRYWIISARWQRFFSGNRAGGNGD